PERASKRPNSSSRSSSIWPKTGWGTSRRSSGATARTGRAAFRRIRSQSPRSCARTSRTFWRKRPASGRTFATRRCARDEAAGRGSVAILKVAHLGNPVLRRTAAKVDPAELAGDAMQRFIDDLIETMHEYDGVGLAAPQVHVSKQLGVIHGESLADDPGAPEGAKRLLVLVNPVVRFRGDKTFVHWEGCLSVPGMRGRVPRRRELEVEA